MNDGLVLFLEIPLKIVLLESETLREKLLQADDENIFFLKMSKTTGYAFI